MKAGRCGRVSNSGEPRKMGDSVLAMVRRDEEMVPNGRESIQ
jgi:hypothetical protein